MSKGGFVVPEEFTRELIEQLRRPNPWADSLSRKDFTPRRRTLRMRYYVWRANIRERLHDWLFPEYRREDDW